MKKLFFALLLTAFSFLAYSQRVISPVKGLFSNRQSLILDLTDGAEAFYSYTSSNPLNSGFAYDGPVLIDMSGPVCLEVAVIKGDEKEQYKIEYIVEEANPFADSTFEKKFIDTVMNQNILTCSGEEVINIPKSLSYSIGDGEKPFMSGKTLSVSVDNKLSRYIPCSVSDGKNLWRFIIYLHGGEVGSLSKASVPFTISDWNEFVFTGKNLIWCIDSGMWSASREKVILNRSQSHTVYWQDVAYKEGNPVHSFVLPPKPELRTESFDRAVVFNLYGDLRYRLSIVSAGVSGETRYDSGLYTTLTFDTFEGDYIDSTAVFALYCDGVYQGNISLNYEIDRQPPLPPKFVPSEIGEYVRHDVNLSVESEKDAKIYLSVLGPFEVKANSYLDNNSELNYVKSGEYVLYKSPAFLRAGVEKTVSYKAFAYAEDKYGNISSVSTYSVIIDEFNYFIDGSAPEYAADGSRLHPYNSFSQVLDVINEGKFVHFFVSGSITLPKGLSKISSNCSFTGMNDARFVLPASSYILVQDSSLEMQNCVLQKDIASSPSSQNFLVFERSAASFEDCEILGNFDSSGTCISTDSSIVTLKKSGLTTQSSVYACGISSNNSRISLSECHIASVSDTAVNFSVRGGSFESRNSECSVISHLGRIIESSASNLKLVSNKYKGEFDNPHSRVNPVWKDEKSLILEDKNNTAEGFSEQGGI